MASEHYSSVDPVLYPNGVTSGSGGSAMSWSAIMAGTVGAIALTLTLLALGSAFGLASVSPWPGMGAKADTFSVGAGVWLIVTQWLAAALGGHVAGRTRTRWQGLHTDEVFFRDTVHGFMAWATATVVVAAVGVSAAALSNIGAAPVDLDTSREAIDAARKVAATVAGFTALSLLVGAFIGGVGGAVGGRLRDRHP